MLKPPSHASNDTGNVLYKHYRTLAGITPVFRIPFVQFFFYIPNKTFAAYYYRRIKLRFFEIHNFFWPRIVKSITNV